MQIIQRKFSGEADLRAMAALVHDFPVGRLESRSSTSQSP